LKARVVSGIRIIAIQNCLNHPSCET
jgi:hypothetical protein